MWLLLQQVSQRDKLSKNKHHNVVQGQMSKGLETIDDRWKMLLFGNK